MLIKMPGDGVVFGRSAYLFRGPTTSTAPEYFACCVEKTMLSVDNTYYTKVYAWSAVNYSLSLMLVKLNNTQNMSVRHGVDDTKDTR